MSAIGGKPSSRTSSKNRQSDRKAKNEADAMQEAAMRADQFRAA
jgi:hypothetical protein